MMKKHWSLIQLVRKNHRRWAPLQSCHPDRIQIAPCIVWNKKWKQKKIEESARRARRRWENQWHEQNGSHGNCISLFCRVCHCLSLGPSITHVFMSRTLSLFLQMYSTLHIRDLSSHHTDTLSSLNTYKDENRQGESEVLYFYRSSSFVD